MNFTPRTLIPLGLVAMIACDKPLNQIAIDESRGQPMLLGLCDRRGFEHPNFKGWFQAGYTGYEVDWESLAPVQDRAQAVEMTVFMGTWCGDSRREVPRLYKILDTLDYEYSNLTLINVDRNKKSPGGEEAGRDIHHVPTIICFRDGREIGRIVEYPVQSLEKDLAQILLGNPLRPHYSDTD